MKPFFLLIAIAVLPLGAQVFEVGGHGGVSRLSRRDIGTFNVGDVDRVTLEDGWRMGFRMTLNNWTFFGHEMGYAYNRTTFRINSTPVVEAGTAIHQGFYNFLAYATPEGSRVRPFAAGGAHFSNFIFPGFSVTQGGGSNKLGYNYGGGNKVRVKPNWAVRMDVRQYVTGKPFDFPDQSGTLKQLEVSLGLSFVM
jgi:opacity protein-like surface antigen